MWSLMPSSDLCLDETKADKHSACTSSIYSEAYIQMEAEFKSSQEVLTIGLSIFVVGLGLGPMLLAPLSEFYGRRPIYVVSIAMFVIWLVPCALAKNVETVSLHPPVAS